MSGHRPELPDGYEALSEVRGGRGVIMHAGVIDRLRTSVEAFRRAELVEALRRYGVGGSCALLPGKWEACVERYGPQKAPIGTLVAVKAWCVALYGIECNVGSRPTLAITGIDLAGEGEASVTARKDAAAEAVRLRGLLS